MSAGNIAFLSAAFRSLSQVNNEGAASLLERVEYTLRREIDLYEREQVQPPPAATADDDIPF